jgi:hypothetical protein
MFAGKEVFRDTGNYEFKPGSWAVGAIIHLPKQAKSGEYILHAAISYHNRNETRSTPFYIDASSQKR